MLVMEKDNPNNIGTVSILNNDFRERLNTEFSKLGSRGISIIVSSGDYGTGCSLCYYFNPSFPGNREY